jgi:putative DNA primase/helicase
MLIEAKVPFYQRGGELVRPIIRTVKAAHGQLTKTAQLKPINSVYMRDTMCRHAHWQRFDVRSREWAQAKAPMDVANTLLARDGVWKFPEILGVIACPTMRPDGSLLVKQGYDPATRLLLVGPPALPAIPDQPTRDDALQALELLEDLLCESPFVDEASKSVALSGLITPVVRGAMPVVPMHAASAPAAGTGKSFLWDLAAAISIGQRRIPVMAAGDEEETEKRLVSVLLTGQPLISIDNVNRELKGEFLAQAIEQQLLELRPLGTSKVVRVEAGGTTIFCTGNNITIAGADLWRRTIIARLDAEIERPQLREFKHNPIKSILDDRGKYIAACLTICRAYIVAGPPGLLPRLASFEVWSDSVRSALVWLGKADPVDTMEDIRADDPERELLAAVLQGWAKHHGVGSGSDVLLNVIVEKATETKTVYDPIPVPVHPEFNAAVRTAAGAIGNARVEVTKFGFYCRSNKGRIVDGLRLMNKPSKRGGAATWWVERR